MEEEPEVHLAEEELWILGESMKLRELIELDDQRFKSADPTQFENAMVEMEKDQCPVSPRKYVCKKTRF